MGVKISGDIAQHLMTKMLEGLDCEIYIDDVGIWTNGNHDEHLELVDKVLERFANNGMKCNPLKCAWAVKETDFLGHWMTPNEIRPWKKKIDAVLLMDKPQTITDIRSLIGAVNYYKSFWPRRAHVLAPLTEYSGKRKFTWNQPQQKAFDEMKAILAADAINAYPDYTQPFDIYTDASDYQLGGAAIL